VNAQDAIDLCIVGSLPEGQKAKYAGAKRESNLPLHYMLSNMSAQRAELALVPFNPTTKKTEATIRDAEG
jgi:hypothetical protein